MVCLFLKKKGTTVADLIITCSIVLGLFPFNEFRGYVYL